MSESYYYSTQEYVSPEHKYRDTAPNEYKIDVVTKPTEHLLTVEKVRRHLRLEEVPDDFIAEFADSQTNETSDIQDLIEVAETNVSNYIRRPILPQTWKFSLRSFNDPHKMNAIWYSDTILLSDAPIRSINSIKYYDQDGVLQTVESSAYTVEGLDTSGGGITRDVRITPTERWEFIYSNDRDFPVEIEADVGWSSIANIPAPLKQGALVMIWDMYNSRSEFSFRVPVYTVPRSVKYLLGQYKRVRV